jgi:amino acid transporter
VVIGVALALGAIVIFLNYLGALLPGSPSNIWLLIGLGCLLVGIIAATQYH